MERNRRSSSLTVNDGNIGDISEGPGTHGVKPWGAINAVFKLDRVRSSPISIDIPSNARRASITDNNQLALNVHPRKRREVRIGESMELTVASPTPAATSFHP
eukprot:CAMPEP_0184682778 /NCGR_PEP_ID=MMETSP0312-20130426/8720_1 /TAXON_ID=31354 /ORGANISM="Compsopogon coeruleus, Strain SAG 36.94" /LENGTH=102 /DNA_ID=CAMNT_0027134677 /DNA_START=550 /DNA_END=858 /DNA_ORIENTATION=+